MLNFKNPLRRLSLLLIATCVSLQLTTITSLSICAAGQAASIGKIAFVANLDGNWDLFLVDEDGRNLTRLTKTPYDENEPRWSADKQNIVYSASDGQLHILNVASKRDEALNIGDKNDKKINPAFSPDGKKLVYVSCKAKKADDTQLRVFDLDKKTDRILLPQYSAQYFPAWSPDGKQIVYTFVHCSAACGRIIQELWLTDAQGTKASQVLMTDSLCMQPVWSPDGKSIAFSSDKSGNFNISILTMGNKNLAADMNSDAYPQTNPAWSPDGKKIAFVSTKTGRNEIWIKNLENGQLKLLSPFKGKEVECRDVAW